MGRYKGDRGTLLERLLNKIEIDKTTDCWIWQGGKNNIGYGMIRDDDKMRTTHRVSYEEHKGVIPMGMCVLHTCDCPKCVNPGHLRLGTHRDNTQDMIRKGRSNHFGNLDTKTCKHCGKKASPSMIARWHNDNCKLKGKTL